MRSRKSSRFTYANVTSTIALVLALSAGTAYAVNEWTGANIVNESLTGADVRGKAGTTSTAAVDGTLTTHDISGQPADASNGTPFRDGTLTSFDIMNGSLRAVDLGPGAVRSSNVDDETLTGADVQNDSLDTSDIQNLHGSDLQSESLTGTQIVESTLGQVPSAALGGIGRSAGTFSCDPESETFVDCGFTTLTLPGTSRVLILGRLEVSAESGADLGQGVCRVVTSVGVVPGTSANVHAYEFDGNVVSLVGVSGALGPGTYDFGIECHQYEFSGNAVEYREATVAAVALSPN